jgi:flagellar motor switch protein FliN/FliY
MDMAHNMALERTLLDIPVQVDVVLGEARMPVEDLLALSEGDILALERDKTDLVDIYVSDRLMARGRLVVADGELGITLSEIVDSRRPAA